MAYQCDCPGIPKGQAAPCLGATAVDVDAAGIPDLHGQLTEGKRVGVDLGALEVIRAD
jgi:hypothetical protein